MCEPGGLGHRDVDDHHQFQGLKGLPACDRVGQRVRGIAAFHDHGPEPVRVVGQDFLGHHIAGHQSGDDGGAGDRCAAGELAEQRSERRMQVLATSFREVAGEDPEQLVQIGAQRAVGCLLHAEVFEHRDTGGRADAPRRRTQQFLVDPAMLGVVGDRNLAQRGAHGIRAAHMLAEKCFVAQVFLDEDGGQRGQAPCIGAGSHPQVEVGHLGGVGDHRIDDDHRAGRIFGDLVEHHPRSRKALRHPRVLPDEHRDFGVLEFAPGMATVEVPVDPGLTGFLLRQRI